MLNLWVVPIEPTKDVHLPLCNLKALMGSLLTGVLLIGIGHLSQCGNFGREGMASLQRCRVPFWPKHKNKKEQLFKNQNPENCYNMSQYIYETSILHILEVSIGSQIKHTESRLPPGMKVSDWHRPKPTAPQRWSASVGGMPTMRAPCIMRHTKKMPKAEKANLFFCSPPAFNCIA